MRLDVWTALLNRGAKRPVMVWPHGGGFTAGSSQELPAYDDENLARQGVVLVSINHRVGHLESIDVSAMGGDARSGSSSVPRHDPGIGMVRDNIAQCGRDPCCVTIFGQSGGGAKVSTLITTPLAKRLFHGTIVQSGSFHGGGTPAEAQELTAAILAELGIAAGYPAVLQAVPPRQIDRSQQHRPS